MRTILMVSFLTNKHMKENSDPWSTSSKRKRPLLTNSLSRSLYLAVRLKESISKELVWAKTNLKSTLNYKKAIPSCNLKSNRKTVRSICLSARSPAQNLGNFCITQDQPNDQRLYQNSSRSRKKRTRKQRPNQAD